MSEPRKPIIRVTATDLETGETQTYDTPAGEYVLIVTYPAYVSHTQLWAGGKTVQVTIKDRIP